MGLSLFCERAQVEREGLWCVTRIAGKLKAFLFKGSGIIGLRTTRPEALAVWVPINALISSAERPERQRGNQLETGDSTLTLLRLEVFAPVAYSVLTVAKDVQPGCSVPGDQIIQNRHTQE